MSHALVIGAGPAGLMAADVISAAGHQVTVADQMPSVGRKFLMAGKSGLNLTKDAPQDVFAQAFSPLPNQLADAVAAFGPAEVQAWAASLGQEVFTGSTGRVFPTAMKASPLLRAWLARLTAAGVALRTRMRWTGWNANGSAVFVSPVGTETIKADVVVLALGGASWARLGSDGAWAKLLSATAPFQPANCGFRISWTDHMAPFFGKPVKATALSAGGLSSRGEWVITARGIEGGGVYEVSAAARDGAVLLLDLAPDLSIDEVAARLGRQRSKLSRSQKLNKALRFPPIKAALLNELSHSSRMSHPNDIAMTIKTFELPHVGPLELDTAISTAGGVSWDALTADYMLRDRPGVFVAGEMLNWEAPTGGYLITGCLATGRAAGLGVIGRLTS